MRLRRLCSTLSCVLFQVLEGGVQYVKPLSSALLPFCVCHLWSYPPPCHTLHLFSFKLEHRGWEVWLFPFPLEVWVTTEHGRGGPPTLSTMPFVPWQPLTNRNSCRLCFPCHLQPWASICWRQTSSSETSCNMLSLYWSYFNRIHLLNLIAVQEGR